jgi:prophage regulatory protein
MRRTRVNQRERESPNRGVRTCARSNRRAALILSDRFERLTCGRTIKALMKAMARCVLRPTNRCGAQADTANGGWRPEGNMGSLPTGIDSSQEIEREGKFGGSALTHATASVTSLLGRPTPPKLLRFPHVRERTGLSRSTIWRLERRGEFPKHRRISRNAVGWLEEEISEWIRSKTVEMAV